VCVYFLYFIYKHILLFMHVRCCHAPNPLSIACVILFISVLPARQPILFSPLALQVGTCSGSHKSDIPTLSHKTGRNLCRRYKFRYSCFYRYRYRYRYVEARETLKDLPQPEEKKNNLQIVHVPFAALLQ